MGKNKPLYFKNRYKTDSVYRNHKKNQANQRYLRTKNLPRKTCLIDDCLLLGKARALCSKHYKRQRALEDPLFLKKTSLALKKYRDKNKDKINKTARAYRSKNLDRMREVGRVSDRKRRKKRIEYVILRKKRDKNFHLRMNLASAFYRFLKGSKSDFKWRDLLGLDLNEFKKYIESKFKTGMSWDNYNYNGWHLDHIRPLCSFNLIDISHLKKAWHYTNFQPLWKFDNQSKSGKILTST